MYNHIFESQIFVLIFSIVLIIILSIINKSISFGIRAFLINYTPFFAVSYYISLLFKENFNLKYEISFFIIIELCVLLIYTFFIKLFLAKNRLTKINIDSYRFKKSFKILVIIKLGILCYLLLQDGFGIFSSDNSRISYLNNGSLGIWLTYLDFFIGIFITTSLLNRAIKLRKLDNYFYSFVLLQLLTTILSGSKGAVILWVISFLALYMHFSFRKIHKLIGIISLLLLPVLGLMIFLQHFTGLSFQEINKLIFNRFFLTNDGRGLSLDLSSPTQSLFYFLNNTFRSISGVLGFPPIDKPIGFILYEDGLNLFGVGSNGSITTLMSYYLIDKEFLIISITLALLICISFYTLFLISINKYFKKTIFNGVGYIMGVNFIISFSQDFLAFQINLYFQIILLIWILTKKLLNYNNGIKHNYTLT